MKTLCIVACHTSSELKIKSLVSNIKYFNEISDHIHIINSDEFKGQNIESLLTDYPEITYSYIPNSRLVCQGKWKHYLENNSYEEYDKIILTNDSFLLTGSLQPLLESSEGFEMFGANDSRELKYHITDYFRIYTKQAIKKLLLYYNEQIGKFSLVKFAEIIRKLEVDSTYCFDDYTFDSYYHIPNLRYKRNIHYDTDELKRAVEWGFPFIKLKRLAYTTYDIDDIPEDFDYKTYLDLNSDLAEVVHSCNSNDIYKEYAEKHFLTHGIREGRLYQIGQEIKLPDFLVDIVNKEIGNEFARV